MSGRVVTFYSYKGGTGRTMALANVAMILAANNYRVLTMDWDLEAPGLHRYFLPFIADEELSETRGLLDQLEEYVNLALTDKTEWPTGIQDLQDLADPQRYAIPLDLPAEFRRKDTCLHFLSSGLQDARYSLRVNDFDWQAFYQRLGGRDFIDALRDKARSQYDYVLIDSRTGVSDTSGICTMQMPDTVVACFTYNRQSVYGVAAAARGIKEHNQNIRVIPVAMRVEQGAARLPAAQSFARDVLDPFVTLTNSSTTEYWAKSEVFHNINYCLEESLAAILDSPDSRKGLLADMHWLAEYVSRSTLEKAHVTESLRTQYRRQIQLSMSAAVATEDLSLGSFSDPPLDLVARDKRFLISLSFPGEKREFVDRVARIVASKIGKEKIFYDKYFAAELARPDIDTYLENIYRDDTELMVIFLCAEFVEKEWCGWEWRAIRELIKKRRGSSVMLLRFDDGHIPGLFSTDDFVDVRDRDPDAIARLVLRRLGIEQFADTTFSRDDWEGITARSKELVLIAAEIATLPHYSSFKNADVEAGIKAIENGLSLEDAKHLFASESLSRFVALMEQLRRTVLERIESAEPRTADVDNAFKRTIEQLWSRGSRKAWLCGFSVAAILSSAATGWTLTVDLYQAIGFGLATLGFAFGTVWLLFRPP